MSEMYYVHRYGNWHIASRGNPDTAPAICGETPQLTCWNSRMRFRDYDPRLVADDRTVCGLCLLELVSVAPPESRS